MNALTAILVVAGLTSPVAISSSIPRPSELDPVGLGSCIGQNGAVELRRVMFLENRSLDIETADGPLRVTLLGQTVRFEPLAPVANRGVVSRDIGGMVALGEDDADVDVKLGLLDRRPVLYWRETFQHHIYRQGLFSIEGQSLVALCAGRAGFEISH